MCCDEDRNIFTLGETATIKLIGFGLPCTPSLLLVLVVVECVLLVPHALSLLLQVVVLLLQHLSEVGL